MRIPRGVRRSSELSGLPLRGVRPMGFPVRSGNDFQAVQASRRTPTSLKFHRRRPAFEWANSRSMNAPNNNFLATLQRHRGGAILEEASTLLQELVAAVATTGKGGTLTIKLSVKPATRGQSAVVVQDKITCAPPKVEAEASFWFASNEGELRKDDPRQAALPFATVDGGKTSEPTKTAAAV